MGGFDINFFELLNRDRDRDRDLSDTRQVGAGAAQSTCNGNNLIVLPAAVPSDTSGSGVPPLAVDAVHVLLASRTDGSQA